MSGEEIGKRIGDYEILSELGSGGMGRVYKVRNVLSDRIEAMKVLLPDVATRQELAARFQREIKVLASLNHPNIAALRTALTIDNQLVMIMEYVEGTTLADRLSQGPIPVADTLSHMNQVLGALSYAHQQNVIHRDIKPANIILTPQGVIKVMDFGIARSGDDRSLTMTGTTLGSLSYMSPEQVKGDATDARSDLYSVGITLYELVTGQRPFQAHSDYSIMAAHVKETPKPPIELEHGLPPALNEIILMAIAKDPAQRFQTAVAFRNALSNVHVDAAVAQPAAGVPPDEAVTATMAVPVPAHASQATVSAQVPVAARVTPVSAPPRVPLPVPPPPSTHRGLYMTMGALVVLVVLVVAGIYVPRMSKTHATTSAETQPAAAQTMSPGSQDAVPQTPVPLPPAAADSASSTPPTPQNVPADTNPGASPSTTAATPTPSQPHAPQPRKSSSARAGSGAMVNAALQEAESGGQSKAAAVVPASNAADLEEVEDQVQQISSRAAAVDSSLDHLQQEQNNSGYGLRGDIVAKHANMKANLAKAESAVQQKDPAKAKKYLDMAQGDLEALEHFLGH
jgi:eukaryotic-like serine/threonine-protein kinase